eukprot:Amastigsp_a340121_174.p4 type:complete len:126 gc:universal Amastigsp_a340121_174:626-1003(+)
MSSWATAAATSGSSTTEIASAVEFFKRPKLSSSRAHILCKSLSQSVNKGRPCNLPISCLAHERMMRWRSFRSTSTSSRTSADFAPCVSTVCARTASALAKRPSTPLLQWPQAKPKIGRASRRRLP